MSATLITPEHYQAALDLASRIDNFLQPPSRQGSGGAHFCRRNGQILIHADQVIRAILEDDLADPGTNGETMAAEIVYYLCECVSPNCTKLVGMIRGELVERKTGYFIVKEKVI